MNDDIRNACMGEIENIIRLAGNREFRNETDVAFWIERTCEAAIKEQTGDTLSHKDMITIRNEMADAVCLEILGCHIDGAAA